MLQIDLLALVDVLFGFCNIYIFVVVLDFKIKFIEWACAEDPAGLRASGGDYPRKVKNETPVNTSFAGLAQNFQPDFVVYFSYPFKHSKDLEKGFYMTVMQQSFRHNYKKLPNKVAKHLRPLK